MWVQSINYALVSNRSIIPREESIMISWNITIISIWIRKSHLKGTALWKTHISNQIEISRTIRIAIPLPISLKLFRISMHMIRSNTKCHLRTTVNCNHQWWEINSILSRCRINRWNNLLINSSSSNRMKYWIDHLSKFSSILNHRY